MGHGADGRAQLQIPDSQFAFLYEAAARSLILHAPGEVYPGPYTYKRFWVRDTAFLLHALLCMGLTDRVEKCLLAFWHARLAVGIFCPRKGGTATVRPVAFVAILQPLRPATTIGLARSAATWGKVDRSQASSCRFSATPRRALAGRF